MSSSEAVPEKRMIILKISEDEKFEIEEDVAAESQTIKFLMEDCADDTVPLQNVDSKTLAKVIEYCRYHVKAADNEDTKAFDKEFVKVDQGTLFALLLAANFLDIKGLLELMLQAVADMMKGKKPEVIREMFNIKNDFTPEEEDKIRRENAWAFE